jgi:peptidyl-prolyl cis-trans isomerase C
MLLLNNHHGNNTRTGTSSWLFRTSLVCAFLLSSIVAAARDDDEDEFKADMRNKRALAKPWWMRSIEIGGAKLPISPATAIVVFVVVINIINIFRNPLWAEASHILIEDSSTNTKKMMEAMKNDIGDDLKRFGDYASKYSQCPSKKLKGDLGRFKSGDMAPPFDKILFDPKSPMETVLGPVQTQFGWHLIYIRKRSKL